MRNCRPGPSKVGNTTASGAPHRFVMSRAHTENVACVGPCRMSGGGSTWDDDGEYC